MAEPAPQAEKPEEPRPSAYATHPLLDPRLSSNNPALARLWYSIYRRLVRDPAAHAQLLRESVFPHASAQCAVGSLEGYCRDADTYLDDLLRLLPPAVADALRPAPTTRGANQILELLTLTFDGEDPRQRYEAQRKLYLASLLFRVEHSRSVRDGPRHRTWFERVLQHRLWQQARDQQEVEICWVRAASSGREELRVGVDPKAPQARCWTFQLRVLPSRGSEPAVEVYHYRSRFKGEASPVVEDAKGKIYLGERLRWPRLRRRSGAIVSKMIRRGIGDPGMMQDVLGAMFIVGDRPQAYALEGLLIESFGGPMRWRDRVDALSGVIPIAHNPRSAASFQVLKAVVDVLIEDANAASPYLFPVEVQIYTLEAYLRTVHEGHFANHTAYKERQFLHDLVPLLFPEPVYGDVLTRYLAS